MNAPVLLASDLLMADNAKILTNAPLKMEGASISATIPSALFHALQFATIQDMLWCMTRYDLLFVPGLLRPLALT